MHGVEVTFNGITSVLNVRKYLLIYTTVIDGRHADGQRANGNHIRQISF
jgi:hypothetical protein